MARPLSITPELERDILRLVRAGYYTTTIAARVGLSRTTLWNWVHQGEAEGAPPALAAFAKKFRVAEAQAEIGALRKLRRYGAGVEKGSDWKSVAWFMERRWPKKYAGRSEDHREKDEPEAAKTKMGRDEARELAKKSRLHAVQGGKR